MGVTATVGPSETGQHAVSTTDQEETAFAACGRCQEGDVYTTEAVQ